MIVMLSSDVQSTEEMNDYAQRNVVPELQRIEGVGQVRLFGAQRAMRIWVDPKKLQNYNLSFADVGSALSAQNIQISAGYRFASRCARTDGYGYRNGARAVGYGRRIRQRHPPRQYRRF